MDERYYDEFDNKFYNPDDDDAKPGANLNWKKIQRGFKRVEDATAESYSLAAEGYAKGTQNGEPVEEGSPYYQNNAKYFADDAGEAAQHAEEIAESIPEDYVELTNEVAELKNALQTISPTEAYSITTWNQGTINTSGANSNSDTRCRTNTYYQFDGISLAVSVKTGYQISIAEYSGSTASTYIGRLRQFSAADGIYSIRSDRYYRFVVKKDDDSDLVYSDVPTDVMSLTALKSIPDTIKKSVDAIDSEQAIYSHYNWVQGGINATTGANTTATNRCRSKVLYFCDNPVTISVKTGYKFNVTRYAIPGESSSFIDNLGYFRTEPTLVQTDFNWLRIVIAETDDSDFTPADVPGDVIAISAVGDYANLPAYYTDGYINGRIKAINDNMGAVGAHGETFAFITDLHWDTGNMKRSPILMDNVMTGTNINTIICGGDIINNGEKDIEKQRVLDCIKAFYFTQALFPVAFGNHDSNANGQTDQPEKHFSADEIYALMYKQVSNYVNFISTDAFNFTFDRPATKTRFLFIDTGLISNVSTLPKREIFNSLNDIPAGYNLIVVGHWLYAAGAQQYTDFGADLVSVLDAYNSKETITIDDRTYDYTGAVGKVQMIVCGHSHIDAQIVTPGGIPLLMTDSDNYERSDNVAERTPNTLAEQCFDVVSINYTTNEINTVRIGYGFDRHFENGVWS